MQDREITRYGHLSFVITAQITAHEYVYLHKIKYLLLLSCINRDLYYERQ